MSAAPLVSLVLTLSHSGGSESRELELPAGSLLGGVAALETLNNEIEVWRGGGLGSGRGLQFHNVLGHAVKPAAVLGARLQIDYPSLTWD